MNSPSLLPPFSSEEYSLFCQKIVARFSVHLSDYKPDQMSRRIAGLAKQSGCTSFLDYFRSLEQDAPALIRFLDLMTINVTELFRNPSLFDELAKFIVPEIPRAKDGSLNAWSAGSSYGAEAFTLAVLFDEIQQGKPYSVKGTDIDLAMLAKANAPSFSEADMAHVTPERKAKYFISPDDKTYMPKLAIKKNVHFSRHDLLSDVYPTAQYELILCRNVVIYFNDDARQRIYEGFFRALKPGGVLFLGGTERIGNAAQVGFEMVRPFFYRKSIAAMKMAA